VYTVREVFLGREKIVKGGDTAPVGVLLEELHNRPILFTQGQQELGFSSERFGSAEELPPEEEEEEDESSSVPASARAREWVELSSPSDMGNNGAFLRAGTRLYQKLPRMPLINVGSELARAVCQKREQAR